SIDTLTDGRSLAVAPRRMRKEHRAKRIEQSYRVSAYSFLPHASRTAVLVLCLNLGRTYTFHCRRKSKRASKWLGFLVNVRFWSALAKRHRVAASTVLRDAVHVIHRPPRVDRG